MTVAEQLKEEGKLEAIEQRNEAIACNLLKAGSDIEFVAKMTGLPLEQVTALKAENQDKQGAAT